jgi:hypothetical protein
LIRDGFSFQQVSYFADVAVKNAREKDRVPDAVAQRLCEFKREYPQVKFEEYASALSTCDWVSLSDGFASLTKNDTYKRKDMQSCLRTILKCGNPYYLNQVILRLDFNKLLNDEMKTLFAKSNLSDNLCYILYQMIAEPHRFPIKEEDKTRMIKGLISNRDILNKNIEILKPLINGASERSTAEKFLLIHPKLEQICNIIEKIGFNNLVTNNALEYIQTRRDIGDISTRITNLTAEQK